MRERLQKIISGRGLASRRKAEEWIQQGRVTVNGMVASIGATADIASDSIEIDGKPLPQQNEMVYLMLHKPRGYVTTLSDEKGRKDVTALIQDCGTRVYPIGRLDMDSEGLLLFTNDGDFANTLMHPKHTVDKEYTVTVENYTPENAEALKKPITLDGYRIAEPEVSVIRTQGNSAVFRIIIHEGRNRQIRRMCEAAHMRVTRLKRVREGTIQLGDLPLGKWRFLTSEEITNLKK